MKSKPFRETIAKLIEHTNLKPTATPAEISKLCEEAKTHGFGAVCVAPCYVRLAAKLLEGSGVRVVAAVGFPLGSTSTEVKAFETQRAVLNGADEVDVVINLGLLKAGKGASVVGDLKAVVEAARGKAVKVILETCYLTDEEKIKACELAAEAGARFVKTSTGFGPAGANVHDVRLMRKTVGPRMGVKASGGIRSLEQVLELIEAGADRIGTSASVSIILQLRKQINE